MQDHTPKALKAARRLRREMTLPEVLLWQRLRGKPMGVKFRRQHPVGDHVVDFYCASKRIAIEIDGTAHDMANRPQRDAIRDAAIAGHDIEIRRIAAVEVLKDVDAVAQSIVRYCAAAPPPSASRTPPPRGEEFTRTFQ